MSLHIFSLISRRGGEVTDPIIRVCCLCGQTLPQMTNVEAFTKGFAIQRDNHVYWHCGRHTRKEMEDLKIPRYGFTSALKIKRRGEVLPSREK